MAASYSSFLSSRFYSPVFSTALFDGPFRIYFSPSYETTALKIYHLLQVEKRDLWTKFKKWSDGNKQHVFILIYPTEKETAMVFEDYKNSPVMKAWEDGVAIGFHNSMENFDVNQIFQLMEKLSSSIDQNKNLLDEYF